VSVERAGSRYSQDSQVGTAGEVLIRNGRANPGAQGAEYAQTADRGMGETGGRDRVRMIVLSIW